jgi:peroxiredoxin Q/BCP
MSTHSREPEGPRRGPKRRDEPRPLPWRSGLVALGVVALLLASFAVPRLFEEPSRAGLPAAGHGAMAAAAAGDGVERGTVVEFSERNVSTGVPITSSTLRGRKTLLFFSEGVMCQACFVQIRDIEKVEDELGKRGIDLVSITPDPPDVLRQAIGQYGIRTPMIADDDRNMSAAFDTLGQGMHPDTPGHAFVLLDERGSVAWHRDYWLAPDRTMYVDPERLLADIPAA